MNRLMTITGAAKRALDKFAAGDLHFLRHPIRSYRSYTFQRWLCEQLAARWAGIDSDSFLQEQACISLVSELMGIPSAQLDHFVHELKDSQLIQTVNAKIMGLRQAAGAKDPGVLSHNPMGSVFLYLLLRASRPDVVVETGVANGESSAFLLQALEDNGEGRLYSVDLPSQEADNGQGYYVPSSLGVGWLVPKRLRYRWELTLGPAQIELPQLLSRLGSIGMFFHDSLHTYEHMLWEYRTAWRYLRPRGVLASDDVGVAWVDFQRNHGGRCVFYFGITAMLKP